MGFLILLSHCVPGPLKPSGFTRCVGSDVVYSILLSDKACLVTTGNVTRCDHYNSAIRL